MKMETAQQTVTLNLPGIGEFEVAKPPRGEDLDYYLADLSTLPARERIRRSLRQIACTEAADCNFADKLGTKPSSVCNWLRGKCLPEIEVLDNIASVYNVSMEDIFAGTACTNSYKGQLPGGLTAVSVPVYGTDDTVSFPAGIISALPAGTEPVAYKVADTSMANLIPAGAIALIAPCEDATDADAPYLIEHNGKHMLRKITKYAAGVLLSPACDDPTYKEELVENGQLEALKIVGKVVWYQLPTFIDWTNSK